MCMYYSIVECEASMFQFRDSLRSARDIDGARVRPTLPLHCYSMCCRQGVARVNVAHVWRRVWQVARGRRLWLFTTGCSASCTRPSAHLPSTKLPQRQAPCVAVLCLSSTRCAFRHSAPCTCICCSAFIQCPAHNAVAPAAIPPPTPPP